MKKLLIALGLVTTVALVGCNKEKAPETGATTGEHLENAADQAGHDIKNDTREAEVKSEQALDKAAEETAKAADDAAAAASRAADATAEAARKATASTAAAVEEGAQDVREKAEN
ncbi:MULTISPECIES: hypothetical protein [Acinetobacter]|uniref:Protein tolA n=1 Tax=Acinetobacter pecorum TaxID=2762215 RepID=A0ABR8VVD6_9GAMM|nr:MULTISPECIES: hypothetical protein [Acinetobacter]MBD8008732.1 hypothetical protein [Acinetobacter pecorum]OAL80505.1 hypothetical protein AY607_02095 [Acinetobacter sp. SFA]OAL84384.1 hypothetical protein AY605_06880 [Acinetobacter sp. SFD]